MKGIMVAKYMILLVLSIFCYRFITDFVQSFQLVEGPKANWLKREDGDGNTFPGAE